MPTGFFRHQDVQATHIRRQFLRGVLRGDLLNKACLIRLVRVGGRGTVRVRLHVPLPARVGTIHVMHLWDEEGGRSTGDKLPMYLQTGRREQDTIHVSFVRPRPVNDRTRRPSPRRQYPIPVVAKGTIDRFRGPIFAVPTERIMRRVLREVVSERVIKVRVASSVPIPRFRSFARNIRHGAHRCPLICQTGVRIRAVPFTVFRLHNRHVMSRFVAALRGFVRLRNRGLFNHRATLLSRSFNNPMCAFRHFTGRRLIQERPMVHLHPPRNVFFKGAHPRTVLHRARRRQLCVISLPVSIRFLGHPIRYDKRGRQRHFVILVSKHRSLREEVNFPHSPSRDHFKKGTSKLLRVGKRHFQVRVGFKVMHRPAVLFRRQFFRFGVGERLQLVVFRNHLVDVHVGGLCLLT